MCQRVLKRVRVTGGKPIYGQTIDIAWVKCGNRYGGAASGPGGRVPATGVAWSPRIGQVGIINRGKSARDSTRIRLDSVGLSDPCAGDPKVYTNPTSCLSGGGYYGYGRGYGNRYNYGYY